MRLVIVAVVTLLLVPALQAEVTLLARWDASPDADYSSGDQCATNAALSEDGQGLPFKDAGPHRALRFTKESRFTFPLRCIAPAGSFSVWFKPATLDKTPIIFTYGHPGPVELYFRTFKKQGLVLFLRMYTSKGKNKAADFYAPVPEVKPDAWQYIAMTWNHEAGRVAVYLNGREVIKADGIAFATRHPKRPVALGGLWGDATYPAAQGLFDELVVESGELTAAEVARRNEAIRQGTRVAYSAIDLGKLKETLAERVDAIANLLRAADYLRLTAPAARRTLDACQRALADKAAAGDAVHAGRLQKASVRAEKTRAGLRARIVKHLNEMPPVTLPASDDWFDSMRICEKGDFARKPHAEAALDMFLQGFNTYNTLEGGAQFTWNAPDMAARVQPLMPENRALFGKITAMCHKLGIRVILHSTSGFVDRRILERHPSWSVVDVRTGKPASTTGSYERLAFMCFNNPEWRRQFFGNLLEIGREAQPDGFMPDEMHWFPDQYVCACDICRARFKKETGFDIPDPKDPNVWQNWNSPQWRAWIDARRRWITEFTREFRKNVIEPLGGPRVFMTCSTGPSKPWRWESGVDEIDFARNGMNTHFFEAECSPTHVRKRYAYAVYWPKYYREMKLLRAVGRRFGGEAVTFGYPETSGARDSEQFFFWALCKTLGNEGYDYFPKCPDGLMNWERRHADLFVDNRSFADIGIVYSSTTKFLYPGRQKNGIGYPHEGRVDSHLWDAVLEFYGWCETLAENHAPFDALVEDDMERPMLDRYKLVILPNVALMSDAQAQAIKAYVRAGGRVLATCDTSLFDETGARREGFALAELFGADDAAKDYGKGRCVYIREPLGLRHQSPGGYHRATHFKDTRNPEDGARMLAAVAALRDGAGPWAVRNAPKGVIANAFRQGDGVVVHLLNALGGIRKNGEEITPEQRVSYPLVADHNGGKDMEISVASPNLTTATLYSPDRPESVELPVLRQGDRVIVTVNPALLDRYSVVAIEP